MSQLKNTPFPDFLIPGILLFAFVGIFPIAVAYGLWRRPSWCWPDAVNPFKRIHWSWAGSLAAGIILIVWIIVQIQMIEVGWLHVICLIWGVILVFLTLLPGVRRYYSLGS